MTKRSVALLAGGAGVVLVTVAAVALLGGDPGGPPATASPVAPATPASVSAPRETAPGPATSDDEAPPTSAGGAVAPPPSTPGPAPTGSGAALLEQVRAIVARGEAAADEGAERAAASDLARVLADLKARGEGALGDARALLAPAAPPGVQEVGARVLAAIGTPAALEALAAFARTRGPVPPRLQALRGLAASDLPAARGGLIDVAKDPRADPETRAYALDLMREVVGAEGALHEVAVDPTAPAEVRAMALDALLTLEPARGREALEEVAGDPALAPFLEALRAR